MDELLTILVLGLVSASLYAVAASGLVVTYTTSGIFNFAHGAVAMISAFVYWQLSSPEAWGLPVPLALVLTLLVFAPGLGWAIDVVLMRRLHDATPITRIVVPIGLLVALIQVATILWPPATVKASLPRYFPGQDIELAGIVIEYHSLLVFAVAIAVAIGLRLFLFNTRTGTAMRAVVDSRELAELNGVSADRVSGLAWALGCSLAGLAGILIGPILGNNLDQSQLTLLVINAYAAAMVGRLRSLPLTALGALILGIARAATTQYSEDLPSWITVDTVPAIMLFIVLIVVPQDKATLFGPRKDRSRIPDPTWRTVGIASLVLVAFAAILPEIAQQLADWSGPLTPNQTLEALGYGLALGIIALSLVPLTGYAGQMSLAQLAFAGLGAAVMYRYGSDGNPLALVAVVLVCALIGALVALPTLRLKGLYLALATFAFALFCEKGIFLRIDDFNSSNAVYERLGIGDVRASSDRSYLILMAVTFVVLGVMVNALRRGRFGRHLQAMKDSPAACATLGIDLSALKLQVFALSAGMAGLGGALLAGWRGVAGIDQFSLLQGNYPGLPLLLMAVVAGIAAIAGALLAGLLLAAFPLVGDAFPPLKDLMALLPGLAGISLASNPDGAISQAITKVRARLDKERLDQRPETAGSRAAAMLVPAAPALVPERLPVGTTAAPGDRAAIDGELGLDWGRCHADTRSS